jgi:hypothetical protein
MGHNLYRMLRASAVFPTATSGEQAVALIIADICMDATRRPPQNMNAASRVCEDLGITAGTLGNILAKLAARGLELRVPIGKDKRGRLVYAARRHAVDYLFPLLPPRDSKAPLTDGALGAEPEPKGPRTDGPLTLEGPRTDGPLTLEGPRTDGASESNGPSLDGQRSTPGWTPTPMTPIDQKMTPGRIGDPIADELPEDQGQDQERSVGKSQNRRLPDGSDENPLDAYPPATGTTAGSPQTARASEPAADRRCELGADCLAPSAPLPGDKRYHIGCELLLRRAAAVAS